MRGVWVVTMLVLVAACAPDRNDAAKPQASETAAAAPVETPTASPTPPAVARKVEEDTALYEFSYAYPAQAAAIPALTVELEADLAKQRRELVAAAREGQAAAKDSGFTFNPYSHAVDWSVVTELPGWLSLSGAAYEYTGGAHPNHWSQALLWDKTAGKSRSAAELFQSKAALSAAIRQPFCAALNRERAARRGEPVAPDSDDPFDACIDPLDSTVILGSSTGQQFDRIGILIAPYEAGPYVEGDYEITLPVTPAVMAVVKPQYRSVFALRR